MSREVNISRDNCLDLYFDELGQISYSRLIDHKIVNITITTDDIVKTLSNLSQMDDDTFKLTSTLSKGASNEV